MIATTMMTVFDTPPGGAAPSFDDMDVPFPPAAVVVLEPDPVFPVVALPVVWDNPDEPVWLLPLLSVVEPVADAPVDAGLSTAPVLV